MSRSILLIGGAGYIGPVVAKELLKDGNQVTVLDSLIYDNKFAIKDCLLNERFHFVCGDMGHEPTLKSALTGITDVVILAGLVGDPITKKYPKESSTINDDSIKTCLKLLAKSDLGKVIFVSTCSNYGLIPGGALADEAYPTAPLSSYAKSKVENEEFFFGLESDGFTPTILRFATAFGVAPRMRFDLTINEFVRDLALGRELLVFDPDTWRPYCHVRDFAEIIKLVLSAPSELVGKQIFNAGSETNNFTKRQVVELIKKYVPNTNITFKENGSDPRNYKVNFSKIRDILGFKPKFSVELGILEVLDYIKSSEYITDESNRNYSGNYTLETP